MMVFVTTANRDIVPTMCQYLSPVHFSVYCFHKVTKQVRWLTEIQFASPPLGAGSGGGAVTTVSCAVVRM